MKTACGIAALCHAAASGEESAQHRVAAGTTLPRTLRRPRARARTSVEQVVGVPRYMRRRHPARRCHPPAQPSPYRPLSPLELGGGNRATNGR